MSATLWSLLEEEGKRTSDEDEERDVMKIFLKTILREKKKNHNNNRTSLSGSFQNNNMPWIPCGESRNFRLDKSNKFSPGTPYMRGKVKVILIYANTLFFI